MENIPRLVKVIVSRFGGDKFNIALAVHCRAGFLYLLCVDAWTGVRQQRVSGRGGRVTAALIIA